MLIWSAMLIPFVMAVILLAFFHHRTKWWEFAIPLAVSALLCGGFKVLAEYSATKDMEIWNGWVTQARYYEDWNEYIHKTCTMCVAHDKNGACSSTITYDCSYVDYHPEHWQITESNGYEFEVTKATYDYLVRLFLPLGAHPIFVELNRNYHTNDGDMYQADWPGTDATVEPVNLSFNYENRVQASRSVFNYEHISEEEAQKAGLFSYPDVTLFNYPAVLGDCGEHTKEANDLLRFHNSKLGRDKKLRMWLLCTPSTDPTFGQLQESFWVGGNKNEVVLVLGEGWTHVFSWTDSKEALIEIRDYAASVREPLSIVSFMAARLAKEKELRRDFQEFSYLTVETPTWAIVVTFVVTLLVNLGLSYFIIVNEFHDDDHYYGYRRNPFARLRR